MTDSATTLNPYRDKRVFVTGATGIVGGWLVRSLIEDGAQVIALVRDEPAKSEFIRNGDFARVTQVRGDLSNERFLARVMLDYEIEVVFHLGAQTQVRTAQLDPFTTFEANVRGTYAVADAARSSRHVLAIVIASSDKAYGASSQLPYLESHPLAGRGIYDASKSAADTIATAYAASYGLPLLIARCGNIYGGGDLNWDRIVPGTIRSLLRGERPVIRSNGSLRRDYIFVEDAVSAYRSLGEAAIGGSHFGEAFNFGHGVPVPVLSIVDELRDLTGRTDLEPIVLDLAGSEIPDQYLDASKARELLGWRPSHDLRDGLALTLAWYEELFSE